MAQGGLLVRDGVVSRITAIRMACGGVVTTINRIVIACDGIAREVWPSNLGELRGIVMTTTPALSVDVEFDQQADAFLQLDAATGELVYASKNSPDQVADTETRELVIQPAPQTGQYFVRVFDVIGGITGSGIDLWLDAAESPAWSLLNDNIGTTVTGSLRLELAANDGGAPSTVTVVKPIAFRATRGGSTDNPGFRFTGVPWLLQDRVRQGDAQVAFAATYDFTVGRFEGWEGLPNNSVTLSLSENYSDPPNELETIQVDLVSGETPTGPALGVEHPLSWTLNETTQKWELRLPATEPEGVKESVVDVTIFDGFGNGVTKRVTLRVERDEDLVSELDPDFLTDNNSITDGIAQPNQLPLRTARASFVMRTNGVGDGLVFSTATDMIGFPQKWNQDAPFTADSNRFEIMLTLISGDTPQGDIVGDWLNLGVERRWFVESKATSISGFPEIVRQAELMVSIRQVGLESTRIDRPLFLNSFAFPLDNPE